MKRIFDANDPKSYKHINEAYLEASDFAAAAKWLVKYLSDNNAKMCGYYQLHGSENGAIGADALARVINTTCTWIEKEFVK